MYRYFLPGGLLLPSLLHGGKEYRIFTSIIYRVVNLINLGQMGVFNLSNKNLNCYGAKMRSFERFSTHVSVISRNPAPQVTKQ